ncbi:F120C protein, partial [Atractosteus spatula]|nr:F120C protein [Atractosteus spatula]
MSPVEPLGGVLPQGSQSGLTPASIPSPAQPSSVAESDSEGPPKVEFVDNRMKTLDEKLRTLLYQEYSASGTSPAATPPTSSTSPPQSSTSVTAGVTTASAAAAPAGEDALPPPPTPAALPAPSSSDTSPHSSTSSTSSSTSCSRSSSYPDLAGVMQGSEATVGKVLAAEVPPIAPPAPPSSDAGAVQRQPAPSSSSPSSSPSPTVHPPPPAHKGTDPLPIEPAVFVTTVPLMPPDQLEEEKETKGSGRPRASSQRTAEPQRPPHPNLADTHKTVGRFSVTRAQTQGTDSSPLTPEREAGGSSNECAPACPPRGYSPSPPMSSDDEESELEDEDLKKELQKLREKHIQEVVSLQAQQNQELQELYRQLRLLKEHKNAPSTPPPSQCLSPRRPRSAKAKLRSRPQSFSQTDNGLAHLGVQPSCCLSGEECRLSNPTPSEVDGQMGALGGLHSHSCPQGFSQHAPAVNCSCVFCEGPLTCSNAHALPAASANKKGMFTDELHKLVDDWTKETVGNALTKPSLNQIKQIQQKQEIGVWNQPSESSGSGWFPAGPAGHSCGMGIPAAPKRCPGAAVPVDLLKLARTAARQQPLHYPHPASLGAPAAHPPPPARILIDADSGLQRLYGGYQTDWVCGGEWNAMLGYLAALSQACLYQGGLELVVIFNGTLGKDRWPEWARRAQGQRQTAQLIVNHVASKGTPPPRAWWPFSLPPCCSQVVQTLEDHHQEVISLYRDCGFQGLIAHDSEYALCNIPAYFSSHALKLSWNGKNLTTNQYLLPEVARQLGLKPVHFPAFAALLVEGGAERGNHILPDEDLAAFHWSLLGPEHPLASLKVRAHQLVLPPCEVVIKAVSEYVSSIKDLGNLDAVARDVFKQSQSRMEDKVERFKKAVEYFSAASKPRPLAMGPSPYLRKPAYPSGSYPGGSGHGPALLFQAPPPMQDCNDSLAKAAFSDWSAPYDGSSGGGPQGHGPRYPNHHVPAPPGPPSAPGSSPSSSSDGEEQNEASANHVPDKSRPKGGWEEGGKGDGGGGGVGDGLQGNGSSHIPSLLSMATRTHMDITTPPLPQVVAEVLRVAEHRHRRGLMYPYIYHILTKGEMKIPVCIEDECNPDLPPAALLFRSARQYAYGVLFSLAETQRRLERLALRKRVPLEGVLVGGDQGYVWGREQGCVWGRGRKQGYMLREIMGISEGRGVCEGDISEKEIEQGQVDCCLSRLCVDKLDSRGIQLAALFMCGVDTALFVNDACGQPIPWDHCCPWGYFDGKLFQSKLARATRERGALLDMCEGQEEQVSRVEKMRQAILEGISLTPFMPPMVPPFYPVPLYPRPLGALPPHGQHRPRAFPGIQAIPSHGGKLEIAGMVVGQWAGNKPVRGRAGFNVQVVSVGGGGRGRGRDLSIKGRGGKKPMASRQQVGSTSPSSNGAPKQAEDSKVRALIGGAAPHLNGSSPAPASGQAPEPQPAPTQAQPVQCALPSRDSQSGARVPSSSEADDPCCPDDCTDGASAALQKEQ